MIRIGTIVKDGRGRIGEVRRISRMGAIIEFGGENGIRTPRQYQGCMDNARRVHVMGQRFKSIVLNYSTMWLV